MHSRNQISRGNRRKANQEVACPVQSYPCAKPVGSSEQGNGMSVARNRRFASGVQETDESAIYRNLIWTDLRQTDIPPSDVFADWVELWSQRKIRSQLRRHHVECDLCYGPVLLIEVDGYADPHYRVLHLLLMCGVSGASQVLWSLLG